MGYNPIFISVCIVHAPSNSPIEGFWPPPTLDVLTRGGRKSEEFLPLVAILSCVHLPRRTSRRNWSPKHMEIPLVGVSPNGWFIVEKPIKVDDSGVPPFSETPILDLIFMLADCITWGCCKRQTSWPGWPPNTGKNEVLIRWTPESHMPKLNEFWNCSTCEKIGFQMWKDVFNCVHMCISNYIFKLISIHDGHWYLESSRRVPPGRCSREHRNISS